MALSPKSSGVIRTGPYPELTGTAVLVGYFLGAVIAVSIGMLIGGAVAGVIVAFPMILSAVRGWGRC